MCSSDLAVATVDFDVEGIHYHREAFASYPGNAIFLLLEADRPVMEVDISLESELRCQVTEEKGGLRFTGRCPEHLDPSYVRKGEEAVVWGYRGKSFQGRIRVVDTDGILQTGQGVLRVGKASRIILVLEVYTPAKLEGEYAGWKAEHIRD